jgi:hypothetical protein
MACAICIVLLPAVDTGMIRLQNLDCALHALCHLEIEQ